jgi:hypothetical protein
MWVHTPYPYLSPQGGKELHRFGAQARLRSKFKADRLPNALCLHPAAPSVNFRFTSSTAPSASARCSPGRAPPLGWCGISISGSFAIPKNFASVRPNSMKIDWQRVTVGFPFFCNSIASWTLHDVHEPHAPKPVIIASHRPTISSMIVLGAPCM